ncbi:site-specific DNA-methyltransferase [Duganella sp. FT80W]|uniref:Site-specific DNA-methyltransferase n=1 Tax=Duganella guangzhouensis TaxID=2666084 RepID=A0A6I2L8F7_9BURK|nr:site-specific DNA-methyltransferase [Duganella guangzhouensis]MRW94501.1 site-specific DNA-methyltransferase [Duganella guangzhouensis]
MTITTTPAQESLLPPRRDGGTTNVEKYEFEPIKGYPMLNWRGKRPFTSTQYYPAQLKEVHGEEVDGWRNKIFWGDNLQVMSHLLKEFRGKVDLIYIDPPFDSKADYKKSIQLRSAKAIGDQSSFEEKQYTDIWNNDEYLQFLYERLVLLRELLSEKGAIFVHVGTGVSHFVRCVLEEIFGKERFVNEIIWRKAFAHNDPGRCGNIHDAIYYFSKSPERTWNKVFQKIDKDYVDTFFDSFDPDRNERYNRLPMDAPRHGDGGNLVYEWKGVWPSPGRTWATTKDKMEAYDLQGRIHYPKSGGVPRLKRYESEHEGTVIQDLWTDINKLHNLATEAAGYPTQKPEALVDRIVRAASNPGDLVLDCFMGSGTTQAVSMKLGRRFIGADINLAAIQTTTKRLINVAEKMRQKSLDGEFKQFGGFELYNVNHYDVFRNPIQAKDLLIEALEVQKLEFNTVFDGEKDGRMVKIMPINRIATRADLNELIAGFDYKTWERRQNENPNRPVEKVSLVCMGHESDLAAQLELAAKPFKINVEVVDILRDKSNLEFKRDSEAKVTIKKGELAIEKFYPMNLLQKLSIQKESVGDWKELTESVLIDWNYDGAVLQPAVVDIPAKDELVKGTYKVPDDAGTIRVKITDLLSESWEGSVSNGD